MATLKLAPDDKLLRKKNYALPVITAVTLLIIEKLLPNGRITTLGTAGKWRRGEGYCTKRDAVMKALGNVGKDGFTKEETDGWVKDLSVMGIRELEWLKDVPDQGGIKKRKADVTEKYDRQLQEEIMAVKVVNRPARKKPTPKNTGVAATAVENKEEVSVAAALPAPMGPVAPVVPVAPVAPMAPVAPVAPVAPMAPLAPVAPMAARTPRSRTNSEPRRREKEESGIGTMMQDRVDYLNAKRRKIYVSWHDVILERCNDVEQELQGQTQAVRA
jgi:origin recognition complex subunit 6